ncbi:MAG: TetR family transcriptional regulator [Anaerolineales bacterium]|nr:TetR family transcriptional regulator [Anaerolineales bacterium]
MLKHAILEAATRLFIERGFHNTTVEDIASAAGMSEMGVYREATSKQEILLAILDRELDELSADLHSVVNTDLRPEEKLRLAIQMYVGRISEDIELSTLVLLEYRSLEPDFQARHIIRRDRLEQLWRQILREGVRAGVFRPVDVSVVSFAILGMQNWMFSWYQQYGRLKPLELSDRFADLIFRGIQVEKQSFHRSAD